MNWVILSSALQVAQVICFLLNCFCRFDSLLYGQQCLYSYFSIRMLNYCQVSTWYDVCGLGKFLTVWMFYSSTLCKLHLHQQERL